LEAPIYRIAFSPRAERDFRALAPEIRRRLKPRIDALAHHPRPRGVNTLSGEERLLRLRVADYRVVYQVHGHTLTILVLKIGHRRDVYRKP
jgi:mRNA interferase RelE/StbE